MPRSAVRFFRWAFGQLGYAYDWTTGLKDPRRATRIIILCAGPHDSRSARLTPAILAENDRESFAREYEELLIEFHSHEAWTAPTG